MRLTPTAVVIAAILVAPHAAAQKPKPGATKEAKATIEGEVGRKLHEKMLGVDRADGGFCGNVLVSVGRKVLLENGYGIADETKKRPMPVDALWDWASVSKQFTAAAILKLQDKKKLKLDDPIKKFYSEVRNEQANVTIRQLLNHTSGIEAGFKKEWQFDAGSRESFEKLHTGLPIKNKPGEVFEYNNSAYAFAAAIVEKVSKKTFEEFCTEELFKPAGMKEAGFIGVPQLDLQRVPKVNRGAGFTDRPRDFAFAYGNTLNWGYRGCGGAVMSTRDLHRWDRALRGDRLLSKPALDELYKPALGGYALGWRMREVRSGRVASHSGGVFGVVAYLERGLDQDYCIAMVSSGEPKTHPEKLAAELLEIALEK